MQNLQCSVFKIATCEAFLLNTIILSLKKIENYMKGKKDKYAICNSPIQAQVCFS